MKKMIQKNKSSPNHLVKQTGLLVSRARNPAFCGINRAGRNLNRSPLFASQRDALAKRSPGGNGGSPNREKRNRRLLGEANAFLRGPRPVDLRERSSSAEANERNKLSEIIPIFFSTKTRLIQKNFCPPGNKKCGKTKVCRGDS